MAGYDCVRTLPPGRRIQALIRRLILSVFCLTTGAIASERPNFLFILTDDQSPYTLSTYGNNVCQTPNINRISTEGMTIVDAHHMGSYTGAVCLPSRTMIMTGRTVWRIPHRRSGRNAKQDDPQASPDFIEEAAGNSMAALFNNAGYDTFRTCKKGNTFGPANQKFKVLHEADKREGDDENGSKWHGDRAVDFLKQRIADRDDDPFLMFLGFSHPHDPRNGKPELLKKYGAENLRQPPSRLNPAAPPLPVEYLPAHPFHHGHPGLRDETTVQGVLTDRSEATIRNELGREYACIENIDVQVGRVLDLLQQTGELDNTYVFFTSDHGIAVGRHGLTGKQNLYEHTWRVPFLVRGPGVKAGSRASGFIYLLDVLPTMCDLAGIHRPEKMEGLSFRNVLDGSQNRIRDTLYGVYCGGTKPGMRSVKTADGWKLIKYDVMDGQVRETQLFNLNENPFELLGDHHASTVISITGNTPLPHQKNLADDPRFAAKRLQLEAALLAEQVRLDDPYRLWDQPQLPQ
ncbi:MAG: sulfatase-like hydrolase/transferase [Planctomycetaceae bacterium]|nr:sulfatase-like hydrolase/transferase [Planctomycetaceae bacterium]